MRRPLQTIGLTALLSLPLLGALALPAPAAPASEPVSIRYSIVKETTTLTGQLYRPDAAGPAPAVVLMHGCGGVWSLQREWARRLQSWGYVALVLDSFGPRGVEAICPELDSGQPHQGNYVARVFDAYGAHGYLSALDVVDAERIALLGWSHGAEVGLRVATGTAVNLALVKPRPRSLRRDHCLLSLVRRRGDDQSRAGHLDR